MPKSSSSNDSFNNSLINALKHFNNTEWLGNNSPLARSYFLGTHLQNVTHPETKNGQGLALKKLILQAVKNIWGDELPKSQNSLLAQVAEERAKSGNAGPKYHFLLLDIRYLRQYFSPNIAPTQVSVIYEDILNVSESRFFVHLKSARNRLNEELVNLIKPSIRTETPILDCKLIGREDIYNKCIQDIQSLQSISLSGIGGTGKTSLGISIAQTWPKEKLFWYTFHPGLNDDLNSLVFSLAHFFKRNGHPSMWLQLIAQKDKVSPAQQALGLIRNIVSDNASQFLFCFDEIDLLHTSTKQNRHGVHKQILEFIEGIKREIPIVLIGQRAIIDTVHHYELEPLTTEQVRRIFSLNKKAIDLDKAELVQAYTEGNPRLVELYIALIDFEGEIENVDLYKKAAVKPLFNRLWKRLNHSEKKILNNLCVYRDYAPLDLWEDEESLLNLKKRKLLKFDNHGGVTLISTIKQLIFNELSSDQKQNFNLNAASERLKRGQVTEAAYHLWESDEIEQAIDLWYQHQDIEINQGKAGCAHATFILGSNRNLHLDYRNKLTVIQNRINSLFGENAKILENTDNFVWHNDDEITADIFAQRGEAKLVTGDSEAALDHLSDSISILTNLSTKTSIFHRRRGQMFIGQGETKSAEKEAKLIEFEAHRLKGHIEMSKGDFKKAQSYLLKAFKIADTASDDLKRAKTSHSLVAAFGNAGDLQHARQYAQIAIDYYETIGDRVQREGVNAELAGINLNVGNFIDVLEPGLSALGFFESINHEKWANNLRSNLAEAYYEIGDIDLAEKYALQAVQSENPRVVPYACYTLGLVYHAQKKPQSSQDTFQLGITSSEKIGDQFIKAYLHRAYGKTLLESERNEEGQKELETSLKIFSGLNLQHEVQATQKLLT